MWIEIGTALLMAAGQPKPSKKIEPKPFVDTSKMDAHQLVGYACQLAYIRAIDLKAQHDENQYALNTGDFSELHDWDAEIERVSRKIGEITINLALKPPHINLDPATCPQFAPKG